MEYFPFSLLYYTAIIIVPICSSVHHMKSINHIRLTLYVIPTHSTEAKNVLFKTGCTRLPVSACH